jgi:4-hydroxyphenylpyruvate dioxygenase
MNTWVQWYADVLGFALFKHFDDKDISTEYSALMSKVMDSGSGLIKIPINEPAEGKRKSQVQEYLDFTNNVAGVQHMAFRCNDALETVAELRRRGVDFLRLPDTYYEKVWDRVEGEMGAHVSEDHQRIRDLGILVDADDEGYLLQLFTMPLQDRPTLFIEIICRRGSQSFGKGNFRALFESLELEQARRGNL